MEKLVEQEILKTVPCFWRSGAASEPKRLLPKSALFLPRRRSTIASRIAHNIQVGADRHWQGAILDSLGEVVNSAMELVGNGRQATAGRSAEKDYHLLQRMSCCWGTAAHLQQ